MLHFLFNQQILQKGLQWLNDWENDVVLNKDIKAAQVAAEKKTTNRKKKKAKELPSYYNCEDEFLTHGTAHGLRITITSTLELCAYLIEKGYPSIR